MDADKSRPTVKKIYKEFKSKGLEVLGVSLDTEKERWLKAVNEDELSWIQVCDFDGFKGDVVKDFNLKFIPQFYILDRHGKIVAKGLRGEALYNKVKEIFENE